MSAATIRKVNQLKESLAKESGKDNSERCNDILNQLDAIPDICIRVLSETLVGTVVSKLKSHKDDKVASQAKHLVKKWKQIAKQGGIGSTASNSHTSSNSSAAVVAKTDKKTAAGTVTSGQVKKSPTSEPTPASALSCSSSSQPFLQSSSSFSSSDPSSSSEWEHLPPLRKNTVKKLHETFQLSSDSLTQSEIHMDAIQSLTISRSTEVEAACHEHAKGIKQTYIDKIRSLIFNLKKNADLRENVLLGSTSPETLVQLEPEQMATAEKSKEISDRLARLKDSRRLDWEQANESKINEMCGIKGDLLKASLFTCGRCKSIKTTSTQKQTRSADEPMTVFVLCLNCGNRWKC